MSLLLRVRGFLFAEQTRKTLSQIAWIAEIAASQIVADRKGNAFIAEKIVKNCSAFYYYHCLSILALLSIEIIDSLAACRVDNIS